MIGRELGKACVLGVLGGTFVSIWAYERILGPLRPPPAIRHTATSCLFERRAWLAEAGLVRWRAGIERRPQRSRMSQDVLRHHLVKGMAMSSVQELLGWPDVIENGGRWVYRLGSGTDLLVTSNLWGGIANISTRIS